MQKERPILFSAPMVCAILEGRKTQTRRIYKADKAVHQISSENMESEICVTEAICPYGKVGDRLWVRETFGYGTRPDPLSGWVDGIEYRADEKYIDEIEYLPLYPIPEGVEYDDSKSGWKPSIFMPRWASRITLEIVNVGIEQLQDITEEDAKVEGCEAEFEMNAADFISGKTLIESTYKTGYKHLWDKINGAGSWEKNPFVWVIEFKRIDNHATPPRD